MTSNCGEVLPYLAFVLFRVPLPLTIIQILAIDLGTDMFPALALGAEPPAEDTMRRPPRPKGERLLSLQVLVRAYGVLGLVEGAAGLAAYAAVLHGGGWHRGMPLVSSDPIYAQATTAYLGGIIALQMVAVFLCRHETQSIFKQGLFGNPMLLAGVGLEALMLLTLNYAPPIQGLLGTATVPVVGWWILLPFILLMVALEEFRKARTRALKMVLH
jgi:magnesium-transporting ATPase (P-type)